MNNKDLVILNWPLRNS